MQKKRLKPYVAVILVILYAIDIFGLSQILQLRFGLLGTVMHEIVLLLMGVGIVFAFRADLKKVFPFRMPTMPQVFGTLIFWIGAFLGTMVITLIVAYFFPAQMLGASQGLQGMMLDGPFIIMFLVVAVTPAICEEIAFRGALLGSVNYIRNKWIAIILVSVIFGCFHGSIWRAILTSLLGICMGYLLYETNNMFYNMFFHMINNTAPLILLSLVKILYSAPGMGDTTAMAESMAMTSLPLASVAIYMLYGGAAPLLLYIGNHLIHYGRPGYDKGLFPKEKRNVLIGLIATGAGIMFVGILLFALSLIVDQGFIQEVERMM